MQKNIFTQIATGILMVGLSVLVVVLARENMQLKERLDGSRKPREALKPNDTLSILKVSTLKGDSLELDFTKEQQKMLLFVFSTTCPVCVKSLDAWNQISKSPAAKQYKVLGISTYDLKMTLDYTTTHKLAFPVYVARDTTLGIRFKVTFVPQTLQVKPFGVVENNWGGLVDSVRQQEILSRL